MEDKYKKYRDYYSALRMFKETGKLLNEARFGASWEDTETRDEINAAYDSNRLRSKALLKLIAERDEK